MTDVAIRAEGLSKAYHLNSTQRRTRYRTLQDELFEMPRRWLTGAGRKRTELFWALRDVSFNVRPGEVLGVIGRNGAGKSTLLKLLARITDPTQGQAEIYGRVGSLLEVGTGFHPELTGRENVYLSGAVLGMTQHEVRRRFDEIVAFAEIEQHLDTPAKHYSSGMYMRLAFAVAAHLEPEILLVDEVLAVGDVEFQKKCLGKVGEVAQSGRTILFVSHNLAAVQRICQTGLVLDHGQPTYYGAAQGAIEHYVSTIWKAKDQQAVTRSSKYGSPLTFLGAHIRNANNEPATVITYLEGGQVVIEYEVAQPMRNMQVTFELWHPEFGCVFVSSNMDVSREAGNAAPGRYQAVCALPPQWVRPGSYWIDLVASEPKVQMLDEWHEATTFDVIDDGSPVANIALERRGVVLPVLPWQVGLIS